MTESATALGKRKLIEPAEASNIPDSVLGGRARAQGVRTDSAEQGLVAPISTTVPVQQVLPTRTLHSLVHQSHAMSMMPTHHFTSPMTQQPLLPTGPHHSFPATSTALAASTLAAMTSSTAAATLSNPASTHYEGVPSVEAALVSMRQQRAQRARTALSQQPPMLLSTLARAAQAQHLSPAHMPMLMSQPMQPHVVAMAYPPMMHRPPNTQVLTQPPQAVPMSAHINTPSTSFDASAPASSASAPAEPRFICQHCGASFSRSNSLTTHMRVHTGQKPFQCADCGATFSLNGSLTKHQRLHTGSKPYACDLCSARFSQSSNLTVHRRTHTNERPYSCPECHASFAQSGTLTKHLRVHTGEKPFGCDHCPARFSQKANLNVHLRLHRPNSPVKDSQAVAAPTPSSPVSANATEGRDS